MNNSNQVKIRNDKGENSKVLVEWNEIISLNFVIDDGVFFTTPTSDEYYRIKF